MAATTTNILIFGATGLIGTNITKSILDNKSSFKRIGIFTSSNTIWTKSEEIDQLKQQGVEIFSGDITSITDVNEALSGFDTVVSCVGRPVIHHQLQLIDLADKHADVKRFFPSEYGTDIEYGPESANEKPHQQKLRVRSLMKGVKNLEYTYVVTGPYADADRGLYLSARPQNENGGTFDVQKKRAVLLGDGNGKISLTTMRDVGKFVVAALLHPEVAKNQALIVNSFTSTPAEIAKEYEKQTGDKWEISCTSLDELKRFEQEAWEKGDAQAGGFTLRRIWTSGGTLYDQTATKSLEMEGKTDTLQSTIEQAIEIQRRDG